MPVSLRRRLMMMYNISCRAGGSASLTSDVSVTVLLHPDEFMSQQR